MAKVFIQEKENGEMKELKRYYLVGFYDKENYVESAEVSIKQLLYVKFLLDKLVEKYKKDFMEKKLTGSEVDNFLSDLLKSLEDVKKEGENHL